MPGVANALSADPTQQHSTVEGNAEDTVAAWRDEALSGLSELLPALRRVYYAYVFSGYPKDTAKAANLSLSNEQFRTFVKHCNASPKLAQVENRTLGIIKCSM